MIPIPFCGPAYSSDSLNISAQTCVNLYPEINESNSKAVVALKSTPGLKPWVTLTGGGPIRGLYKASNNRFFAVCGNTLSEVTPNGVITVRGTIRTFEGIVRMSDNGVDLIVLDSLIGEGWTLLFSDNTFAQITDAGYPQGSHIAFTSQLYVINKPNTQQFFWSALEDGTSWDGLDFALSQGSPDNINSLIALGSDIWVFGPQSYEVFQFTGTTFERVGGTNRDIGNASPNSLTKSDANIFWLGGDGAGQGIVYMSEGYSYVRISTHAIEQTIQRYSKIDDAIGYCYQQLGHKFYVLSFPTASTTWVYDLNTGMWHERNYTDSNCVKYMHRGIVQEYFNGKVCVGDWLSHNIYHLDVYTYTDNGEEIHRERACPHIWNNLEIAYYGALELDVEAGVGLVSGQGENPQIMLDFSDDHGHTWYGETWDSAGRLGEYSKIVRWDRLGSSNSRTFRIKMSDPVKWTILGAYIDLKG